MGFCPEMSQLTDQRIAWTSVSMRKMDPQATTASRLVVACSVSVEQTIWRQQQPTLQEEEEMVEHQQHPTRSTATPVLTIPCASIPDQVQNVPLKQLAKRSLLLERSLFLTSIMS